MTGLKEQFKSQPRKVVRDYVKYWEEQLEAEGKPWTWRDVEQQINSCRYRSVQRDFLMQGEILKHLLKGKSNIAAAQTVQNMKAIHQLSTDGTWKAAWPLTFMPDPLDRHHHGGTEMEVETILSYLKSQDDLQVKTGKLAGHNHGDAEEEEEAKKTKGQGKGK